MAEPSRDWTTERGTPKLRAVECKAMLEPAVAAVAGTVARMPVCTEES